MNIKKYLKPPPSYDQNVGHIQKVEVGTANFKTPSALQYPGPIHVW